MSQRVAASLLHALGHDIAQHLISSDLLDYEERAVTLAEDSDALYSLRTSIESRKHSCAAFDSVRWTRNYEQGLALIYRRHEWGLSPEHVEVEDKAPVFSAEEADAGRSLL